MVFNILIAKEFGESEKACGPSLYNYGIFIFVLVGTQLCCSSSASERRNNR